MNNYKTSDTPLAAYLVYLGYPILETKLIRNRHFFLFDDSNNGIHDAIFAFESGNAQGNIPAYFDTYQRLLRIIKANNDRV